VDSRKRLQKIYDIYNASVGFDTGLRNFLRDWGGNNPINNDSRNCSGSFLQNLKVREAGGKAPSKKKPVCSVKRRLLAPSRGIEGGW